MASQNVLDLLGQWITTVLHALPVKLRPTFAELIIGAIISPKGHITSALASIKYGLSWGAYHKAIEAGKFCHEHLVQQWLEVILSVLPSSTKVLTVAIDDVICMRSSKKAPLAAFHHDHAFRSNRPKFLWGQLMVCAGAVVECAGRAGAVPLLQSLVDTKGNTSKLEHALRILGSIHGWLQGRLALRILVDAWYAKSKFILNAMSLGSHVIAIVRYDTALKEILPPMASEKKRGRPKLYGEKLTFALIQCRFALERITAHAYGKERLFEAYCFDAHVVFLKHRICRLVLCRMQNEKLKDGWTRWHLLLSTDTDQSLNATEIIRVYALRWWIESSFHELKHTWGVKDLWQQSKLALDRWRTVVCIAYGLPRLLAIILGDQAGKELLPIAWRPNAPATAGWVSQGLHRIFYNSPVRKLWDRKAQKIIMQIRSSA